jgi:hypothetical protein
LYDTALAKKNPIYKLLVDETNKQDLLAGARVLDIEKTLNEKLKKARKSRPRGIIERLFPTDRAIFEFIESENKAELAKDMTEEELDAAKYIIELYADMRNYLAQHEIMENFRENYITHSRKGFLETLAYNGPKKAIKGMFQQQEMDRATFQILQGDTGNILPLEKFFQFSLQRTGEIDPTQNVAKAVMGYVHSFEKMRALNNTIPTMDIFVSAISPDNKTPRGLERDRSLKQFYNTWMNNKKGRRFDAGGWLKQGGKMDTTIKGITALTSLLYVGLSVKLAIATKAGENSANYIALGGKKYSQGILRAQTKQGRMIIEKYKNLIGKSIFEKLSEASNDIGDVASGIAFAGFHDAAQRANKTFLMGSITEEEFKSGEISPERLAEIKRDLGRYRVVDGAGSVYGSTSAGKALMQFKSWALPYLMTTSRNLKFVLKEKKLNTREGQELVRSALLMSVIAILSSALLSDDEDEKDKTWTRKMIEAVRRDALSLIGALDLKLWTKVPPTAQFVGDISIAIDKLIRLEQYEKDGEGYKEGDLKGINAIQGKLTPAALRQFGFDPNDKDIPEELDGLDSTVEEYLKEKKKEEEEMDKLFEDIKKDGLTQAEKDQLTQMVSDGKITAQQVETRLRPDLTQEEKLLNKLQVRDGSRARAIYDRLQLVEDKQAYVDRLEKVGVLSEDVKKQLAKLLNQ